MARRRCRSPRARRLTWLLRKGESPNWAVRNLGTALGFEPGLELERTELTLHTGDALVFYTDGVSEAFNPQDECYGNERLLADAGTFAGKSAPISYFGGCLLVVEIVDISTDVI
jgi:hypothetical protein